MGNDNLRAALQEAGMRPDDLAEAIAVDVKTVRRWTYGMVPYPRHRAKVARALGTTQEQLWPDLAITPPEPRSPPQPPEPDSPPSPPGVSDLIVAYPAADDLSAPDWQALMAGASERIELLDETLIHILGVEGIPELLSSKATDGCQIRVLYANPANNWVNHREGIERRSGPDLDEQQQAANEEAIDARALAWEQASDRAYDLLEPLFDQPNVEIREYIAARFNTILRFDDQMLITLHLWAQPTTQAPLLHLQRRSDGGLFDRFAAHYDALWHDASTPAGAPVPLHPEQPQEERQPVEEPDDITVEAPDDPPSSPSPAEVPHDQARPRRWPGRDS